MQALLKWALAHPIIAWTAIGVAVLAVLIVAGYLIFAGFAIINIQIQGGQRKNRSGANLGEGAFSVTHDQASDEVVFTWTIINRGKFAARRIHTTTSLRAKQRGGFSASWQLIKNIDELGPGEVVDLPIRIARSELVRLALDFDQGTVGLWSFYSSTPPKKPANFCGIYGPQGRRKLAVGHVGGQDCVTVTDLTPLDFLPKPKSRL